MGAADRLTALAYYSAELCRFYICIALIIAALAKLTSFASFRASLLRSFGFGDRLAFVIGGGVIALEGSLAALLLAGARWAWPAMFAALSMFALFTALIATALARGQKLSCNCFGGAGHIVTRVDLVRNAALILACLLYLLVAPNPSVSVAEGVLLAAASVSPLILTTNLDSLLFLLRRRAER